MEVRATGTLRESGKRRFRNFPPSHYTMKIEAFSVLLDCKEEKYETKYFEAAGYKWRMVLYPNGKTKVEDHGHISLFLSIAEPDNISRGLEVIVNVKFFVLDGIRDRFLVIQDAEDKEWRFHKMNTEWGFTKLLSHDALKDPLNGYLVNDRCIFGVEIFVVGTSLKGESLSLVKQPESGLYTWKINNYSALDDNLLTSDVFTVEGRKWNLIFHPEGDSRTTGEHVSLFLCLHDSETLEPEQKLFAKYMLRIKDHTNRKNHDIPFNHWFDVPGVGWGRSKFMLLRTLKDLSKFYLVKDSIIIEAKFDVISAVEDFSQIKEGERCTLAETSFS